MKLHIIFSVAALIAFIYGCKDIGDKSSSLAGLDTTSFSFDASLTNDGRLAFRINPTNQPGNFSIIEFMAESKSRVNEPIPIRQGSSFVTQPLQITSLRFVEQNNKTVCWANTSNLFVINSFQGTGTCLNFVNACDGGTVNSNNCNCGNGKNFTFDDFKALQIANSLCNSGLSNPPSANNQAAATALAATFKTSCLDLRSKGKFNDTTTANPEDMSCQCAAQQNNLITLRELIGSSQNRNDVMARQLNLLCDKYTMENICKSSGVPLATPITSKLITIASATIPRNYASGCKCGAVDVAIEPFLGPTGIDQAKFSAECLAKANIK